MVQPRHGRDHPLGAREPALFSPCARSSLFWKVSVDAGHRDDSSWVDIQSLTAYPGPLRLTSIDAYGRYIFTPPSTTTSADPRRGNVSLQAQPDDRRPGHRRSTGPGRLRRVGQHRLVRRRHRVRIRRRRRQQRGLHDRHLRRRPEVAVLHRRGRRHEEGRRGAGREGGRALGRQQLHPAGQPGQRPHHPAGQRAGLHRPGRHRRRRRRAGRQQSRHPGHRGGPEAGER